MMRRLRHSVLAIAAAAALGASAPAQADPVTLVTVVAYAAAAGEVVIAGTLITTTIAAYVALAASVVGGIYARKRAGRQAAAARDAQLASLQDRCVTLMTSEPEPNVIYGRCAVGGVVLDKITTAKTYIDDNGNTRTKPDALQHIIIGLACHEIEAVHDVFMYGAWVGGWGADGWVTGGPADAPYGKTHAAQITSSVAFNASGVGALPAPPSGYTIYRLIVISLPGSGENGSTVYSSTVTLSASGLSISGGPTSTTCDVTYEITKTVSSVRVEIHTGAANQPASAYLMSVAPTVWTAAHRLAGIPYAVLTLDLDDQRHQGIPGDLAFDTSGRKVLDPRTGQTAWSRNAALCINDWLMSRWGYSLGASDIDTQSVIDAANISDVQIMLPIGGATASGPRYTIDGAFGVNASKETVLADMAESMGGFVAHAAQWSIHAGAWTAPVMSINDDDLVEPIRIIRSATPADERFNSARATYIPEGATKTAEVDPYSNPIYVAADGGREWTPFTLPFTNNKARGANLLRQFVEQARGGMMIQYAGRMRLWPLQVGDRVSVTNAQYGWVDFTFRVIDWQWSPGAAVTLTLVRDVSTSYDPAGASTADPAPNTRLPNPGVVDIPSGLTAVSGSAQLLKQSDGTIIPRVLVSWAAPQTIYMTDSGARTNVSWRRPSDGVWTDLPPLSGGTTSVYISGVRDRDVIIISVQHVNSFGATSRWVAIAHAVLGKSAPPTDVTTLSVAELPTTAARRFSWTHQQDLDHEGYEIRYSATPTATWSTMQVLTRPMGTGLSAEISSPPDGTYRFAIAAIDTSGNYSATPAYVTAVLSGISSLATGGIAGGNLIGNSEFGSLSTAGWVIAPWTATPMLFSGTERGRDLASTWVPSGADAICMVQGARISGTDQTIFSAAYTESLIPVNPLEWYGASVLVAAHRCQIAMFMEFKRQDGTTTAGPSLAWLTSPTTGGVQLTGVSPAGWTLMTCIAQVPSDAAYVRLLVAKGNTATGETSSFAWLLHPQVRRISSGSSSIPPYAPGSPTTVWQLGYKGDIDATKGAPAGTFVAGKAAADVSFATTNFNSRNDRLGTAIIAPSIAVDGTSVDHTLNGDGSADVSFEWTWGGVEAEIDGFIVYVRQGATGSVYAFGSSPPDETQTILRADKRALILYGVAADRWYSFAVRAFRTVDQDVAASGQILSPLMSPGMAAENPYRPSAQIAFAGNVTGTVNGVAAANINVWSSVSGRPANLTYLDGSEAIQNDQIGQSGNMLANSDFVGNSIQGWGFNTTPNVVRDPGTPTTERLRSPTTTLIPVGTNAICIRQVGSANDTTNSQYFDLSKTVDLPVTQFVRYEFSCSLSVHRASGAAVYLVFKNSVGTWLSTTPLLVPAASIPAGGTSLGDFWRGGVFAVAPAGAVSAYIIVRKWDTVIGQPDSYLWMLQPYFGVAGGGQTILSPYSPGAVTSHQQLGLVATDDISPNAATKVITFAVATTSDSLNVQGSNPSWIEIPYTNSSPDAQTASVTITSLREIITASDQTGVNSIGFGVSVLDRTNPPGFVKIGLFPPQTQQVGTAYRTYHVQNMTGGMVYRYSEALSFVVQIPPASTYTFSQFIVLDGSINTFGSPVVVNTVGYSLRIEVIKR